MTRAYSEVFLADAMDNLGTAVECAVLGCGMEGQEFLNLFSVSGLAEEFGKGNVRLVSGMSGIELTKRVLFECGKGDSWTSSAEELTGPGYPPEYWVGQTLAYYQWEKNVQMPRLIRRISYDTARDLYGVLHETDSSKVVKELDHIYYKEETPLAQARRKAGLSQSQLAKAADVSVRSIQLYEQRKNDIRNAQLNRLSAIARALHCRVESIVE